MWEDPIVAEVRKVRDEYAARFHYDLAAIVRDLKRQEAEERKRGRKVVSFPSRRPFAQRKQPKE